MPRIRVTNGPDRNQTQEIGADNVTLGRDPSCDMTLNDKGASRHHAQFFRIGEMCFVRDLESRNGTFVNDARVTEEMLRDGDRIQIGATVLQFESSSQAPSAPAAGDFEYYEEDVLSAVELSLEDLSVVNVGEGGDPISGRHLRALIRLGRLLVGEADEKNLLDKALPFVGQALHAAGAYVFARDPQKGGLTPLGTWDRGGERLEGRISRTIIRRAIQDRRALMTGDAMRDQRFASNDSIVIKKIHSVICAPMSAGVGRPSVLYVPGADNQSAFTEDELELAAAMADQIGMALSHLRAREREAEQLLSAVRALVRACESRDAEETRGTAERLAGYAGAVGRQMHLPAEELKNLQLAALLRGIGRATGGHAATPADGKDGGADAAALADTAQIESSLALAREMMCFGEIEPIIRGSRESFDGNGPGHLSGDHIPLPARILRAAHEFELKTGRLNPEAVERELPRAIMDIEREGGTMLDPEVAQALGRAHRAGDLYLSLDEQWHKVESAPEL